ncbi:S-(hydroxymethyl)glutathione dehydrogenase [Candida viswanathii]|uniref:S-(Hydroxymethyl)glutathione dehydrogenase n=1 Tax=Candida viswanathii TaxID=5486 RepID=A0A367Y089_9ASCO|nr:S-(hydroxymethyl)glutathione dehydrogenase [Candida viswanathii]
MCDNVTVFGGGCEKFGATAFVNPLESPKGVIIDDKLIEMADGGCDFTFDCIGNVDVMRNTLEACHKGWGSSIIICVAPTGKEICTRLFQLITGRLWRGVAFGGVKGRSQLAGIIEDYMVGKLKVDEFARKPLEQIKEAFEDMHTGDCIRAVVNM